MGGGEGVAARPLGKLHDFNLRLRKKLLGVVRHSRKIVLQMAEVAVPRELFQAIPDRIRRLAAKSGAGKTVLLSRQGQLLRLPGERRSMIPPKIWAAIGMSKQAAAKPMKPLLDAGMIRGVGSRKSGAYISG
jgi:hypothetical protein